MRNKTTILGIALAAILGTTILTANTVEAQGGPLGEVLAALADVQSNLGAVLALLQDPNFGLQEIKSEVADIQTKVDDMQSTQYVPFKAVATGLPATCDVVGALNDQDSLVVNSNEDFIITGILMQPFVDEDADFMQVTDVSIDGQFFHLVTNDLLPAGEGTRAFDLMGIEHDKQGGGNFPANIAADGEGPSDVQIGINCIAGANSDINYSEGTIVVLGYKSATDTITVSYVE